MIIVFRVELSPSGAFGVASVDTFVELLRGVVLTPPETSLAPRNEKETTLLAVTAAGLDVCVLVR